jgi:hypothetical protein
MMELATKTMTAESRIGSHRAESGVMKSLRGEGVRTVREATRSMGLRSREIRESEKRSGVAEELPLLHARFARGADEGVRPYTFY